MSFELFHFRGSDKIINKKGLTEDVKLMLQYIDESFSGFAYGKEEMKITSMSVYPA
jgi:hypothetical protein